MKGICIIICSFILIGCGKTEQPKVDTAQQLAEQKAQQEAEQAKQKFINENESVVYGDIKFGMTEKEYNTVVKKTFGDSYFVKLGYYEYRITPMFDEGKLYALYFQTLQQNANYVDTDIKNSWANLVTLIGGKYSTYPEFKSQESEYPKFFDFKTGQIIYTHKWIVGKKRIDIGVGEVKSGSQYYTGAYFYDREVEAKISNANVAKYQQTQEQEKSKF